MNRFENEEQEGRVAITQTLERISPVIDEYPMLPVGEVTFPMDEKVNPLSEYVDFISNIAQNPRSFLQG